MAASHGADELRDIRELLPTAVAFQERLRETKRQLQPAAGFWYPYDILGSLWHLESMLVGPQRDLAALIGGRRVADVGAADGDLAFLLASLGVPCDVVDNAPSNFNHLRGASLLRDHLAGGGSAAVEIHDVDLDRTLALPGQGYGLTFFLGILYHLKNPYGVLESLARQTQHCFLSTRVARCAPDRATALDELPVAYLVGPEECNGDASNYWVFSPQGLLRLVDRTGWDVLTRLHRGELDRSDPASAEGDERMYLLLRSRHFSDTA